MLFKKSSSSSVVTTNKINKRKIFKSKIISTTLTLVTILLFIFLTSNELSGWINNIEASIHQIVTYKNTSSTLTDNGNDVHEQMEQNPATVANTNTEHAKDTNTNKEEKNSILDSKKLINNDEILSNQQVIDHEINSILTTIKATTIKSSLPTPEMMGKKFPGEIPPTQPHSTKTLVKSTITEYKHNDDFDPMISFHEIINTSPVVIFCKFGSKDCEYLTNLLNSEYEITPQPIVVELNKHKHGKLLQDYIQNNKLIVYGETLQGLNYDNELLLDVPYLFINGASIINRGISHDIKKLHKNNQLLDRFNHYASDNVSFKRIGSPSNN
ncbi:uncharacterized protein SCODWIG_02255 [Saccharomycodes ludwigii]|uniref:Uncharacterized protein n=1 Tax=Saccharomycodes ludwigii TaxID=36035 RepID=A0A376B7M7_9ASCO|nr:hypothetical protein SCDLUD_002161 [Saccharomycodes ludwigii]KAH3902341.1 hypothetical protein SCDLUD_002161 [Saccharomycodes ludwigii]SSD60494.1 uncharacterized protein SCODWIG_02255 [Saccharomycodes ludwigii]